MDSDLQQLQEHIERLLQDAAHRGARAFECADPEEIDRQKARLERLKRAEILLCELTGLLSEEAIEPSEPFVLRSDPPKPPEVREPRHYERHALPSHPKKTWVPDLERAMRQSGRVMAWPEIYAAVEPLICDRLLPGDLAPQKGHEPKLVWQYNVDWCMTALHKEGKVVNVRSGRWQIADSGRIAGQ